MPSTRLLLLVRSNVMKSALDQLHDHASQVVDVRRVLDSAWLRLNMNRFFLKLSTASPLWEKLSLVVYYEALQVDLQVSSQ